MKKYNPAQIEKKWQDYWVTNKLFSASENEDKEKKYILVEFPFPSGDGMHMGHVRPYTAADVTARYYRMQGKEVIFPIGWDAFGLPAENYAIKHGKLPAETTAQNVSNIKKQFQSIGYSFDWDREINTTDPDYYKWTQWIFLQFYKAGLAYESTGLINWCPKDKTGLANEEVINGGECERCGTKVEKKELRQWYLKITEYAEKLLAGLETLPEWPEAVKTQQANWIGKKSGINIEYKIHETDYVVTCFTTRPDTNFGATFVVIGPEHNLLKSQNILNIDGPIWKQIEDYKIAAAAKAEEERGDATRIKTGIFTGHYAVNQLNNYHMPIYVADYVLGHVGTGAVVGVPAHDKRDFEFAQVFNIPIVKVVQTDNDDHEEVKTIEQVQESQGQMINSDFLNGLDIHVATTKIMDHMEKKGYGKRVVTYKLRDWVFSRQRYWGEPIPLVHCPVDGVVAIPDDQLPVLLPEVENYEPTGTGESPLAAIDEWVNTVCPQCGGPAKRETNTMPQWAGSSWYYLRYTDAKNENAFASEAAMKYWLPVDIYFGGMEHTTLHLLYSRFWNIFLHDQGLVPVSEPYIKRVPHGLVLAADGSKMSKSKGNVVNPDALLKEHGADTVRMYELFLGPHEASVSWSDLGIVGVARFLDRVWYWIHNATRAEQDTEEVLRELNVTVKKITEDIEAFRFNTAVSSLMSLHNAIKDKPVTVPTMQMFLRLLYPIVPHIAEEMNEILATSIASVATSLQFEQWPQYDPSMLATETANIVIQINGKVKETIAMPIGASEAEVTSAAMALPKIQLNLADRKPTRIIFVPNKVINIVI